MICKKINSKLIGLVFLLIIILFTLTGCGSVKNSRQIKEYIKDNYNIEVEILSVKESEDRKQYSLKEKNRDVTFNCTSSMQSLLIDGSSFGKYEQTIDDYYTNLTKSIENELQTISDKYDVTFEESYYGLIWLIEIDGEKIDFDKTLKVANELMKLYDLKKEPSINETDSIFIKFNDEVTEHYYKYTINGQKTSLGNSDNDFIENWNIPESLEKDALNYVNSLYSGECYIVETSVRPGYREDDNCNYISYIIKNDSERIKKEFRFNIDRYREDLENNTLKSMEEYEQGGIEYIYE